MSTQQTSIRKTYSGQWIAESEVIKNGNTYQITTTKKDTGVIYSTSQKCEIKSTKDAKIISFSLFSGVKDDHITLITEKATATETKIKELHFKALAIFDNLEINQEQRKPELKNIIWMNGYGNCKNSKNNSWVVVEVLGGNKFSCIELTTKQRKFIDHVDNEKYIFGIGHYFNPAQKWTGTNDEWNNLIIDSYQAEKERNEAQNIAAQKAKEAAKVKADYLSQFQNADVRKTGTLLKSYAKTLGLTVTSVRYDSFSMGNSYDIDYTGPVKNEDFEKFCNNLSYGRFDAMEDYSYSIEPEPAILENHILKTFKYVHVNFTESKQEVTPEPITEAITEAITEPNINLILTEYSEKAIALRGDTKIIKDQLKEMGGSFNFKLKGGPGWIFSKKREAEIRKTFNI